MQKLKAEKNKKVNAMPKVLKIKEKVISTLLIGSYIANILCITLQLVCCLLKCLEIVQEQLYV